MQRITITVPDEVLAEVKRRVTVGDAANVSAYFTDAARRATGQDSLDALLDEMDEEFGPVPDEVQEWANRIIAGEIDG